MMCCTTCLCFKDPRRAFIGIGFVTLMLPIVQIAITISEFTGTWTNNQLLFSDDSLPKAKIVYELYIALSVMDFFLALFSVLLLCGNERTDEKKAKCYFTPWFIFVPIYVIYETGANIYYFTNQFAGSFPVPGPLSYGTGGFAIVPIIYSVLKGIIFISSWMFVFHNFKYYCPCRPVEFHSSSPQVALAASSPATNNVYFQGGMIPSMGASCKTCGGVASPSSPMASPSCGCNSGFNMVSHTPVVMHAPAGVSYSQYVEVPAHSAQPSYGVGNQLALGNAKPLGWTSSAYNGFFNRNN